ncbi:MAG TPA: hypothetical protein PLN71_04725 [Anaerolineae bacterium]|nr:hypothetical protein [Anaerolineae bacterium]
MMKQQYRLWVIGVVAILLVAVVAFTGRNSANAEQTLTLQAPAFVRASADESTISNIGTYLSTEAGISAYIQTASSINLNQVRGEFRTIETETANYIIGSVAVPNHPENFDVHVYVHTDGWILAYYLKTDPASKIADVRGGTINSTKLSTVLAIVAGAAGYPTPNVNYYDFRYPNATHILMVAENHEDGRDFTIQMPNDFGYFERSFAISNSGQWGDGLDFWINGVKATRIWTGWDMTYGIITASQLLPGQTHYINLSGNQYPYGVLVITYRVQ